MFYYQQLKAAKTSQNWSRQTSSIICEVHIYYIYGNGSSMSNQRNKNSTGTFSSKMTRSQW